MAEAIPEKLRARLMVGGGLLAEYREIHKCLAVLAATSDDREITRALTEASSMLEEIVVNWSSLFAESRAVFDPQLPTTEFSKCSPTARLALLAETLRAATAGLTRMRRLLEPVRRAN